MKGTNKTLMTCASDLKQQERTHSNSSVSVSARGYSNMSTSVQCVKYFIFHSTKYNTNFSENPGILSLALFG